MIRNYCPKCGSFEFIKAGSSYKCSICGAVYNEYQMSDLLKENNEEINSFKSGFDAIRSRARFNGVTREDFDSLKISMKEFFENLETNLNNKIDNKMDSTLIEIKEKVKEISDFILSTYEESLKNKNSEPVYIPSETQIKSYVASNSIKSFVERAETIDDIRFAQFLMRHKFEKYLNSKDVIKKCSGTLLLDKKQNLGTKIYADGFYMNSDEYLKYLNLYENKQFKFLENLFKKDYKPNAKVLEIDGCKKIFIVFKDESAEANTALFKIWKNSNKFIHYSEENDRKITQQFKTIDDLKNKTFEDARTLCKFNILSKEQLGEG